MLIFETSELAARLAKIKPFFIKKKTLPILDCVRITPKRITYSDLDVFVSVPIQGGGVGDFMVSFPALYEFARSSNESEIRISERTGKITITDLRSEIVQEEYFSPEDFPNVPVNDFNLAGSARTEQIQHAFSCYYAADEDDHRFNLRGVCIDAPTKRIVATNGHRLSFRQMQFTLDIKDQTVVPRYVVKGMLELIKGTSAVMQFSPSQSNKEWLAIGVWDISIYVRVLNQYPDYKSVIPQQGTLKLSVTQPKLALKQLRDIKKRTPKIKPIALKGDANGAVRIGNGHYRGVLEGCKAVKECFLLVNIDYLIDCLKQYEKAEAPLYVWNKDDKATAWFFCAEGSLDLDLIMPLRGNDEELWFAASETPQQVDTPVNNPPQKVAKQEARLPKIKQAATGEKLAGLEWGKKLARALRKRGIRSVAPWGDRLLKISDKKRELFYLAAAYYVVKSR